MPYSVQDQITELTKKLTLHEGLALIYLENHTGIALIYRNTPGET